LDKVVRQLFIARELHPKRKDFAGKALKKLLKSYAVLVEPNGD
jgi:hypothetical protein